MPTYEYQCRSCKNRFEIWQRMADEPLTVCPECGGHVRRVFFPAGIVFKGSGFYKTDNAPKAGASENRAGASPAPTTTKSEDTKTGSETKTSGETKPDASTSDSSSSKAGESKETVGTK